MRKLLLGLMFISINSFSQNSESKILIDGVNINEKQDVQYVELLFTQKFLSFKVRCVVDYGQEIEWGSDSRVQDSNGTVKNFNTVIDGLNYFTNNGWVFVDTYPITIANSTVHHFLLKRK